jgi:O-antigen/teichoic acid export membrane protein
MLISFFVSIISFCIVFFFNKQLTNLLGNPDVSPWLYFVPLSIFLLGTYQSLNYWINRKKKYKELAISKVLKSGASVTTNLGMGFAEFGSGGLVAGNFIGQVIATSFLARKVWNKNKNKMKEIKKLKIFALMKKYKSFPKINMPHAFLNVFSSELPILLITYFFYSTLTGFYTLSNRILIAPMSIITGSFGQVFLERISYLHIRQRDEELVFFKSTIIKLLTYSFPIFFLLFVYSKDIFSIAFGKNWETAGVYAQILIPMLYLRFTGSIVSVVAIIHNKQHKALIIEIINTIFRVIALLVGGFMNDIIIGLVLFSAFSFIITMYRLFWYFALIKGEKNEI